MFIILAARYFRRFKIVNKRFVLVFASKRGLKNLPKELYVAAASEEKKIVSAVGQRRSVVPNPMLCATFVLPFVLVLLFVVTSPFIVKIGSRHPYKSPGFHFAKIY